MVGSTPLDVGTKCEAWDDGVSPDCLDDAASDPGRLKGYCARKWCFIDPYNCNVYAPPFVQSAVIPDATFDQMPLYYSYAACGDEDRYSLIETNNCLVEPLAQTCKARDDCIWWADKRLCMDKIAHLKCTTPVNCSKRTLCPSPSCESEASAAQHGLPVHWRENVAGCDETQEIKAWAIEFPDYNPRCKQGGVA